MTDFHRNTQIKSTRKPHSCEQCGRKIETGSTAIYSTGVYYSDFYRYYQHPECQVAGLAYAKLTGCWDEDFVWFQHGMPDSEDEKWLLEYHPIVAERLGFKSEVEA